MEEQIINFDAIKIDPSIIDDDDEFMKIIKEHRYCGVYGRLVNNCNGLSLDFGQLPNYRDSQNTELSLKKYKELYLKIMLIEHKVNEYKQEVSQIIDLQKNKIFLEKVEKDIEIFLGSELEQSGNLDDKIVFGDFCDKFKKWYREIHGNKLYISTKYIIDCIEKLVGHNPGFKGIIGYKFKEKLL